MQSIDQEFFRVHLRIAIAHLSRLPTILITLDLSIERRWSRATSPETFTVVDRNSEPEVMNL